MKVQKEALFYGGLDASTAEILQNAAAIAVLDSISTWKLRHHDSLAHVEFESTVDPFSLSASFEESTNYIDNFVWDFGDGSSSTSSNPTHTYDQPGEYTVQLIGYGPCGNDTTSQTLIFENTSGISQDGSNNTYFIKRINDNTYEIEVSNNQTLSGLHVFNPIGQKLKYEVLSSTDSNIRIRLDQRGLCVLNFSTENYDYSVKIMNR